MVKKTQKSDDEINLIKLAILIFQNKWKIISPIVILVFSVFVYQMTLTKNFIATTKIKPVTTVLEYEYTFFNKQFISLFGNQSVVLYNIEQELELENAEDQEAYSSATKNLNPYRSNIDKLQNNSLLIDITKKLLLDSYIEILSEKKSCEEGMIKFNFLDASQYSDKQAYIDAITYIASSIKIKKQEKDEDNESYFAYIQFKYHDVEKWKNVLRYVDVTANKLVKQNLENKYKLLLSSMEKNKKHELENLSLKIKNVIKDYERNTFNRIAYLKEQSEIARQLGIEKNTIEVQTFGNQNTLFSNVKLDSPFYLRGFRAIDKEIALIESRTDTKAFTPKLFSLEQKKRMVIQDKTMDRAKTLYLSSPIVNNLFYAASANIKATKFAYNNTRNKLLLIAIVIGLIIGLLYVFISNEIQIQKTSRKK